MRELLSGFIAATSLVAALYFLKFWRRSNERLFALFSAAFVVLAVNQAALGLTSADSDFRVWLYGLRLVAFVLILVAVWDRNRR